MASNIMCPFTGLTINTQRSEPFKFFYEENSDFNYAVHVNDCFSLDNLELNFRLLVASEIIKSNRNEKRAVFQETRKDAVFPENIKKAEYLFFEDFRGKQV